MTFITIEIKPIIEAVFTNLDLVTGLKVIKI